jgi:hypothetical protein
MPCPDGDFQVTPRRPSFYSSSLAQISQNCVGGFLPPPHQRRSGCPKHDFLYYIDVNCRRMEIAGSPQGPTAVEWKFPVRVVFMVKTFAV